tara:strand:+ start:2991 stop:3131 length:141 start_codon:yes stop_codon:yes gene_type:complete
MTDKDKKRMIQLIDTWENGDRDTRFIVQSDLFKEFGKNKVKKHLTS